MSSSDINSGFAPVTYTGNGGTQSIRTGFSPDLVWIKSRTDAVAHQLVDTIRGTDSYLFSDSTSGVGTVFDRVTSFDADGFTLGADSPGRVNANGSNYVAWCWDAGDTTVTNNEGTIQSQVRSNGSFSIVNYRPVDYSSIGHSLNTIPELIIYKNRDGSENWRVYHKSLDNKTLYLNTNDADTGDGNKVDAVTSTTFTVGNIGSDDNYIAYCWANSPTQSFGSYTGGSATQAITGLGFKPALVILKRTDALSNWFLLDSKRGPADPDQLYADLDYAEQGGPTINFDDDGFSFNDYAGDANKAGGLYIYAAFGGHSDATVLELADETNLTNFPDGTTVTQIGGNAPVSSAIVNVGNSPIDKTQAYVYTGTPANLADVLANGTLVTTENTWNSSQCLVLINNSGGSIPSMTDVFDANGDTSFYLGLGETYGNAAVDGGSFTADGTRLGGSGGYNNSEWVSMKYSNILSEGTYDMSYRIYDDPAVAYTVVGYYNANSNITFGTVSNVGTANRPLLTLTDDTNLVNFRVGDVAQYSVNGAFLLDNAWPITGNSDVYQDITWQEFTANQAAAYGPVTGYKPINAADTVSPGEDFIYKFNYVADSDQEAFFLFGQNQNLTQTIDVQGDVTNPGTQFITGNTSGAPSEIKIGLKKGVGVFTLEVNTGQVYIYGRSSFGSNGEVYRITEINEDAPSITTDGGSWIGSNGTGETPWNQSKIWSNGANTDREGAQFTVLNAFDGSTETSGVGPGEDASTITITFNPPLDNSSNTFEVFTTIVGGPSNFLVNGSYRNDAITNGQWSLIDKSTYLAGSDEITSVGYEYLTGSNYSKLHGVKINGQILVDTGDAGAPESSVTGPSFTSTGTVASSGSRTVSRAPVTSPITNVTSSGNKVADGAKNSDEFGNVPNGGTPVITNCLPAGIQVDYNNNPLTTLFDGSLDTLLYAVGGRNPSASQFSLNLLELGITSGDQFCIYADMVVTGGVYKPWKVQQIGSGGSVIGAVLTLPEVVLPGSKLDITIAEGAVGLQLFADDPNSSAHQSNIYGFTVNGAWILNSGTVLILTNDKDLNNFEVGDVVQQDTEGVISGTIQPVFGCTNPGNIDPTSASYWENAFNGTTTGYGQVAVFNFGADYEYTDKVEVYMAGSGQSAKYATDGWVTNIPTETWTNITGGGTSTRYAQQISFENGNCTPANVGAVRIDGVILRLTPSDPTTVVSTNLATPSITTDGGTWNVGEVVTGPVKSITETGPYMTLSDVDGRWMETHSDYQSDLKLNNKVRSDDQVLIDTTLYTLLDAEGNVSDLTATDPGYKTQVTGASIQEDVTITFPGVLGDGQTPDETIPDGSAFNVDVLATNVAGSDIALHGDTGASVTPIYTGSPDVPESKFKAVAYTGNSTSQSILCGFAPDLVWIKCRNRARAHQIYDTIRGATKSLASTSEAGSIDDNTGLVSFTGNGFSLGNSGNVNFNPDTYVAWCWSAGETTVTNNEGTIESLVRVSDDFSIVKYTGNSTNGAQVGHGLSDVPGMILAKNLNSSTDWITLHATPGTSTGFGAGHLNNTNSLVDLLASENRAQSWNNQAPDANVFYLGDDNGNFAATLNNSGDEYIAYCWADSPTQNFGTYFGAGNNSSVEVTTGFEPAFLMTKAASAGSDWVIWDNARTASNPRGYNLYANETSPEATIGYNVDFNSDGFTILGEPSGPSHNDPGTTYMYAAFAATTTTFNSEDAGDVAAFNTVKAGLDAFPDNKRAYQIQLRRAIIESTLPRQAKMKFIGEQVDSTVTEAGPFALDKYYPLYETLEAAKEASSNGNAHDHTIDGVEYYMPDAGPALYMGNYGD